MTAVEIGQNYFVADVMYESVKRTNLKRLKVSDEVNLEKSLTLNSYLGGHLVTGDVDCEAEIISIYQEGIAKIYKIKPERKYMKYIVEKGRISIDGASLTVAYISDEDFSVSLIPHTQGNIILGKSNVGDIVNIETDLIAKHIEKLLNYKEEETKKKDISMDFLRENGF